MDSPIINTVQRVRWQSNDQSPTDNTTPNNLLDATETNLDLTLQSEYYNGSSFVINTLDNCSSYLAASTALDFTPYPSDGLDDGETAVTAPTTATMLINGRNNSALTLLLSAPGTGNDGQVDLTLDIPA